MRSELKELGQAVRLIDRARMNLETKEDVRDVARARDMLSNVIERHGDNMDPSTYRVRKA